MHSSSSGTDLRIVGISANFHDSACCLLVNGELVAAAQEERFSRIQHDPSVPKQAFRYCLESADLEVTDLDCVAYYENPMKKLARQIWSGQIECAPGDPFRFSATRPKNQIRQVLGYSGELVFSDHHLSHAASTFFFSGFDEAAILTLDGVGEWATTTYGHGHDDSIRIFEEVDFPNSLGLLYSAITSYLGFAVNDGEYKVMGLAPYGEPAYLDHVNQLIRPGAKGQYRLDRRYFDFTNPSRLYTEALPTLFNAPPRSPGSEITAFHKDVARSVQTKLEEILLSKACYIRERVQSANLCLAGGVALNCVANGKLLRSRIFDNIFVPPASGDAGGALGAAALAHVQRSGKSICRRRLDNACLGPSYSRAEVEALLCDAHIQALDFREDECALLEATVQRLVQGNVVGWFHGRMEFGPRALGARSILADPRGASVRDRINAVVKKRESFRPFAPAVLADCLQEHFDLDRPSPFMMFVCDVTSPLDLRAITHVDGSARVQTVDSETSPRFAALIRAFDRHTGCPILLNTSFNMHDEPIVRHPAEALQCFMLSAIDSLVLEDFIIDRCHLPELSCELADSIPKPSPERSHDVYTFW